MSNIYFLNVSGNILATRHGATEIGACSLPKADYSVRFPVALGDIPQLNSLKFTPDLCGHIISINCGNGDLDIIVTNSNLGGGLDLYGSTWDRATSFKPPGETKCSAKLQSKSIFTYSLWCISTLVQKKIQARRACAPTRYEHLRSTRNVVLKPLEAPYVPSRKTISLNREWYAMVVWGDRHWS